MKRLLLVYTLCTLFLYAPISLSAGKYEARREAAKIVESLTIRERIAQLFILEFSTQPDNALYNKIDQLVIKEKIGGVILMESPLSDYVKKINHLQRISRIPLIVTIDGEWGAAMRVDSVIGFPKQLQLGAMQNDSLVYKVGRAVGNQCRALDIGVNFAPDIDINNNPDNSAINTRSFGENREVVASYGAAYMKGMQDEGILTCAKHFPGHGDTNVDSHYGLPLIPFGMARLDSIELYPFRRLITNGVDMVMIGHLQVPALDSSGTPASISSQIVTQYLKNRLGFDGLIITDALNMKGVSASYPPERLPLEAFKAGVDLILMPESVEKAIDIMEKAVKRGEISEHTLNMRCQKVIEKKIDLGLFSKRRRLSQNTLAKELNRTEYLDLNDKIASSSHILIKNSGVLPLNCNSSESLAVVVFGAENGGEDFISVLQRYRDVDTIMLREGYNKDTLISLSSKLRGYKQVVIAQNNCDNRPQNGYGLDENEQSFIDSLSTKAELVYLYFGNPYALQKIDIANKAAVVVAYSTKPYNINIAAQSLFGAYGFDGKMAVTAGELKYGHGISKEAIKGVIKYRLSAYDEYNRYQFVNSVIEDAIERGDFSKARVMIIQGEDVIFDRGYGNLHDLDKMSLGKIASGMKILPVLGKMVGDSTISTEDFYGKYFPESKFSQILISDLISHKIDNSISSLYSDSVYSAIENLIMKFDNRSDLFDLYMRVGRIESTYDLAKKVVFYSDDFTRRYFHYYGELQNGSIVWFNNDGRVLIFINDGVGESSTNIGAELRFKIFGNQSQ